MPAYTENELARMRERAIASAREMQRRAAIKGGEQRQCNRPNPPPTRPEPPPKPPERTSKPPEKPHEKPKPQRPPAPGRRRQTADNRADNNSLGGRGGYADDIRADVYPDVIYVFDAAHLEKAPFWFRIEEV